MLLKALLSAAVLVGLSASALACDQSKIDLNGFERVISAGSVKETAVIELTFPAKFGGWPVSEVAIRIGSGDSFTAYAPLAFSVQNSTAQAKFELARSSLRGTEVVFIFHPGRGDDGSVIMCDKRVHLDLGSGHAEQFGV